MLFTCVVWEQFGQFGLFNNHPLMVIFTIVSDMWVGDRSPPPQRDINRVLHPQRPSLAPVSAAAAGS